MSVAVVTPWFDHPELAADYFAALRRGPSPDELVIVDNGSTPPLDFADIRLETNTGFSHGSNVGLQAAEANIVLFLNNDVAKGTPGWLTNLAAKVQPGVLAGAQLNYDRHADVDHNGYPYLGGWCLAGMRTDLLHLGGFDETFDEPAYFSDNDLCLRARVAGMRLREVPTGLHHKGGITAGPGWLPHVRKAHAANYERYATLARQLLTDAAA